MPFVALDALTAAAAPPPAERPGELAERGERAWVADGLDMGLS